jgi:hypothetical protein
MGSLSSNFRITGILVAATLVAAGQARADKHTVYDLTPELLAIGASGTITTDAKTGVLSPSDIIDWNITLQYPGPAGIGNDFTLTPSNSYVATEFTTDLTADAAGLHWAFGTHDQQVFDIQVLSIPPSCNCSFFATTDYVRAVGMNYSLPEVLPSDLIAARVHGPAAHLNDLASDVADPAAGVLDPAAGVPEPATWALLLLGFCGLGFITHGRRTEIATSAMG